MVKTIAIDTLPDDFPEEFTFRDLNSWIENIGETNCIGMTLKQEMWYRFLLRPEDQLPRTVTFRGIPIIVIE